jgi:hypothetical protein
MKLSPFLLFSTVQVLAQEPLLKGPQLLWSANVSPVGEGNECTLSPLIPQTLLCTSLDGSVTAFQPQSSDPTKPLWIYMPESFGAAFTLSGSSGVTFSSTGSTFIYSTTDKGSESSKW